MPSGSGSVRGDREKKKPKKDKAAKVLSKPAAMPMHVDVVPKKRKPRDEEEEDDE
jgi:hypothetical protein